MLLGNGKARNVAIIVWLEELERLGKSYYDFLGFLQGLNIQCVASPLHDRDKYTAEDVRKWVKRKESEVGADKLYDSESGELMPEWEKVAPKVGDSKKVHIHVMCKFAGVRTAEYLSTLFADFGLEIGQWRWEKVEHVESMMRYFAHLDQPDKAEYSPFDVVGFGGIDMSCLVRTDTNSRLKTLVEVQGYIKDRNVKNYHTLCDWAFGLRDLEVINCVTGRASYFTGYFKSKHDAEMARMAAKKAAEKAK